jgi:hypothetical protein
MDFLGRSALGYSAQTATAPDLTSQQALNRPSVIRTARLRIVAREFDDVRSTVEGIVSAAGGFVDQMTATGDAGSRRVLRGTLRVPSDRLGEVEDRLRGLGQVVEDTQGSEDVTDQLIDLDARLASARGTEARLTDLLRNRTGRLSDVLDVERELARVRIDIERLNAASTNLGRRVSYATVSLDIAEERRAGLEPGSLSIASRVRVAAADGIELALENIVGAMLSLLRGGPTLLLWIFALASGWLVVRRLWKSRMRESQ